MKTIITLIALTSMFGLFASDASAARCTVDLKSERSSRTLDTFRGHGHTMERACREARSDCRDAIRRGRHSRSSRSLTCVKRRNHRMVTKTCSASMISRHGRFLDSFTGVATGRMERSVRAEACQNAQSRCMRAKQRRGRRGATCRISRR